MDEQSGDRAEEHSGIANLELTPQGSPSYSAAPDGLGNYGTVTGTTNYFMCSADDSFLFSQNDFSGSIIVEFSVAPTGAEYICSCWAGTAATECFFIQYSASTSKFTFGWRGSAGTQMADYTTAVSTDTPYLICWSYDYANTTGQIWVNGLQDGGSVTVADRTAATGHDLEVGQFNLSPADTNIRVGELMLANNHVWTQEQVDWLYNGGLMRSYWEIYLYGSYEPHLDGLTPGARTFSVVAGGAARDGATNDRGAFQAAFDDAVAYRGGDLAKYAAIIFPAGNYKIWHENHSTEIQQYPMIVGSGTTGSPSAGNLLGWFMPGVEDNLAFVGEGIAATVITQWGEDTVTHLGKDPAILTDIRRYHFIGLGENMGTPPYNVLDPLTNVKFRGFKITGDLTRVEQDAFGAPGYDNDNQAFHSGSSFITQCDIRYVHVDGFAGPNLRVGNILIDNCIISNGPTSLPPGDGLGSSVVKNCTFLDNHSTVEFVPVNYSNDVRVRPLTYVDNNDFDSVISIRGKRPVPEINDPGERILFRNNTFRHSAETWDGPGHLIRYAHGLTWENNTHICTGAVGRIFQYFPGGYVGDEDHRRHHLTDHLYENNTIVLGAGNSFGKVFDLFITEELGIPQNFVVRNWTVAEDGGSAGNFMVVDYRVRGMDYQDAADEMDNWVASDWDITLGPGILKNGSDWPVGSYNTSLYAVGGASGYGTPEYPTFLQTAPTTRTFKLRTVGEAETIDANGVSIAPGGALADVVEIMVDGNVGVVYVETPNGNNITSPLTLVGTTSKTCNFVSIDDGATPELEGVFRIFYAADANPFDYEAIIEP